MEVQSIHPAQPGSRLRASAAVFALIVTFGSEVSAAPQKPASADTVLLQLDEGQRETSRALRAQRASHGTAAGESADVHSAVALAERFVALGREHHDERYFGYASAALSNWSRADAPAPVVVLRADIAQHQHRFTEAQTILSSLIERNAADARVWLMSANLHMGQAQPAAARKACQQLFATRESFAGTVCLANAASINGQLRSSYTLVTHLIEQFPADSTDPQLGWALGVAADMAERMGDRGAAEEWLRRALELAPTDLVSRLQLADLLLQGARAEKVMQLLAEQPPSEPVLLRRALAAQHVSNDAAREARDAWLQAVKRSETIGVTLHLRELAVGQIDLLGNPQLALETARRNWDIQREPVDARILLRAARAAGNKEAVALVRVWQQELNYEDKGLL